MKKITRKQFLNLTAIAGVSSALVACGATSSSSEATSDSAATDSQSTADTGEVVELDFMGWAGVEDTKMIEDIIAEFEAQNPNIKVVFENPADYWAKLQTTFQGGQAPDIFYMGFPEFKEYYNQEVLLNMEPYIADMDFSDFYPAGLTAFQNDAGEQYGLPKDWGTYVFYYNKALFEAAGVKTPAEYYAEGNWTMETMLEVAKEIQANSDAEFGVVAESGRWKAFVGDEWVTADKKIDLVSDPQFAADLQFMADLWLVEGVAPTVEDLTSLSATDRFSQGNAAMFMTGRWVAISLTAVEGLEWDIVPMPTARGGDEYTWVDSVCLSVPVNCPHPEEAMKFVKFYTGEFAQAQSGSRGLAIPVTVSVAESDAFLNGIEGVNNAAHIAYEASTLPVFDNWNDSWTAMNNAFTDVWSGATTAAEAVIVAQEAVDSLG